MGPGDGPGPDGKACYLFLALPDLEDEPEDLADDEPDRPEEPDRPDEEDRPDLTEPEERPEEEPPDRGELYERPEDPPERGEL
jgi:hypothetical protein